MRLQDWLTRICGSLTNSTLRTISRRRRTPQLSGSAIVERLEPRQYLSANPVPLGPTVNVNSSSPTSQVSPPAVASNAVGNYVVVWSTTLADHTTEIDGRQYYASGNPMGSQFTISKSSSSSVELIDPLVAINIQGQFVVTWTSATLNSNNEVTGISILAQRFNSLGKAQGTPLAVGTSTEPYLFPTPSSVGIDSRGDFVVVWGSKNSSTPGIGEYVYAQVYNWSGSLKGNRITVATGDGGNTFAEFSTAAMDSSGDFVVVWESFNGTNISIKAQRYNLAGTPTSNLITVANGDGTSNNYNISQREPSVAIDAVGAFVVAWETGDFTGPQEVDSIHAQRYDFRGHASGSAINVYQGDSISYENAPSVAMNGIGDFVVTWWHNNRTNSNTTVYAHAYKSTGQSDGSQITVAQSSNNSNNVFPSVAMNGCDNFVIVWQQYIPQVTNPYKIVAQRYRN